MLLGVAAGIKDNNNSKKKFKSTRDRPHPTRNKSITMCSVENPAKIDLLSFMTLALAPGLCVVPWSREELVVNPFQ